MNWHERYNRMKKDLGYTNKDIAELTGFDYNSIKTMTQPNRNFPKSLKLGIEIYERHVLGVPHLGHYII